MAKANLKLAKKELAEVLQAIENFKADDYTEESWNTLQNAITKATQTEDLEEYNALIKDLDASKLVKILKDVKFRYLKIGNVSYTYINNGDIISTDVISVATEGTIEISTDNGKTFEVYTNYELVNGVTYTVRLKTDNGISPETTFTVDTALITAKIGAKNLTKKGGTFNITADDKLVLSDNVGIKSMVLTLDGEEILNEQEIGQAEFTYTFTKSGTYKIVAEDLAGNEFSVTRFVVNLAQ